MFTAETIAAVQGERARAQSVIDACDAVLALCHPVARVPVVRQPRAVKPPAKTSAAVTAASDTSKVGRYAEAIVKLLSHHSREPHHSADSAVIRREVAELCGVNPAKDESFTGDVSNALQKLKASGRVERTGMVWALVRREK